MISKKMAKALNKQLNAELYSAYLYLSMSSYTSFVNYGGASRWLAGQAKEEMTHAQKFYEYIKSQGEHVILDAVAKPPSEFKSLKHIFEQTLAHEKKVTASIGSLMNAAIAEKDHATQIFLQWFVTEQVEEEESVNEVLAKLAMAGDTPGALYIIDRELGARQ